MFEDLYYDPSNPASYGGVKALLHTARKHGKVTQRQVVEWLQSQDTYTLHKPVRKKIPRNRYTVFKPNELWQADLNDMRGISKHNKGVNYLLTVIDVFSKMLWVKPLKTKSGTEVAKAFKQIFKNGANVPRCLQTDKGTEFTGRAVRNLFKQYKIRYVTTQNPDVKAAVVERVNRTLKTRMWRYLTHKNTLQYINVLPQLVNAYNHSVHRSLGSGLRPVDVVGNNTVFRVWRHMNRSLVKRKKPKFKSGDTVRITKEKGIFTKGYETNFSKELFVVDREYGSFPLPLYVLRDTKGDEIVGRFYEHELQKVIIKSDHLYRIDKILDTKGRGRSKRYFVKWQGYGDEFNSWVLASELKQV